MQGVNILTRVGPLGQAGGAATGLWRWSCNPQLQLPAHRMKRRAAVQIPHTNAPVLIAPFVLISARRWAAGFLDLDEGVEKAVQWLTFVYSWGN